MSTAGGAVSFVYRKVIPSYLFTYFFNMKQQLNRRQLMQQLAAVTLGTIALPSIGLAGTALQQTGEDPAPLYIPPGGGTKGRVGEMDILFKLDESQTGGHIGLWETVIQPGELGAPPHFHKNIDELCYVREGTLHVLCGTELQEVPAGGWHLRPRGLVHTFWNSGPLPARTIDICLPGGHERYMKELASLFEDGKRPVPGAMQQLENKYDIHYRFDLLQDILDRYKVKL